MAIVTVKKKYQVVIPQSVRKQMGVAVGDILEAGVERGKITFTPKSIVDRGIAESLAEFREGRSCGPFGTHKEFIASLHEEAKAVRAKKAKTRSVMQFAYAADLLKNHNKARVTVQRAFDKQSTLLLMSFRRLSLNAKKYGCGQSLASPRQYRLSIKACLSTSG
jgi:AbrB family looped-hinge helix DNA binding protein